MNRRVPSRLARGGSVLGNIVAAAVVLALLVNTATLAEQLTALVRENRAQIAPTLKNLGNVLATLQANQDNLDRSIEALAPFVRVFANTTGNGRWFDTYIQNLVPVPGGVGSPE